MYSCEIDLKTSLAWIGRRFGFYCLKHAWLGINGSYLRSFLS